MGGFPPQGTGGLGTGSIQASIGAPENPILDFNSAIRVPRNSSDTHTFAATGDFKLSAIEVSASGYTKIEIKSGDTGLETTKMIAFTSPSRPIAYIDFKDELQISSGQRILIIRTNRDNQPMNIYSTILGYNQ